MLIVDDVALNDLKIADISKPQSPKLLGETGIEDWLETNPEIADDGQLFTGSFAASLLHDIWVNDVDPGEGENWQAVLSYWDAGFVVLDVNDPNNPVFIKDSTIQTRIQFLAAARQKVMPTQQSSVEKALIRSLVGTKTSTLSIPPSLSMVKITRRLRAALYLR